MKKTSSHFSRQKRIFILLKILDKIQEDNKDARKKIEKSIAAICKEEGISFEHLLYNLFFDVYPLTFRVENSF